MEDSLHLRKQVDDANRRQRLLLLALCVEGGDVERMPSYIINIRDLRRDLLNPEVGLTSCYAM